MLWYGSHLGAYRDRGMIAWDYDGDVALFLTSAVGDAHFKAMLVTFKSKIERLGYRLCQHWMSLRLCPPEAQAWNACRELYQDDPCDYRIMRNCVKRWKRCETAAAPHGSNCVDINVYRLTTVVLRTGSVIKARRAKLSILFPRAVMPFGAVMPSVPKEPRAPKQMYGPKCLDTRCVKRVGKAGM